MKELKIYKRNLDVFITICFVFALLVSLYLLLFPVGDVVTEKMKQDKVSLALNTDKSIYSPGEQVYFQMTALDDQGKPICDAEFELIIEDSLNSFKTLSTKDGTVKINSSCFVYDFTSEPDLEAYYQTDDSGKYKVSFLMKREGEEYKIIDFFEVQESVAFNVERMGPTRIYPPSTYEMIMKIKANQDFKGQIIETAPLSFDVVVPASVQMKIENNTRKIIWHVDWKAGESYELKYMFETPSISPYLYLLGPLGFYEQKSF